MASFSTVTISNSTVVRITPPDSSDGNRTPCDIVIAFDKSGSMSDSANSNGPVELRGFSKMDLAKRAAEIIAQGLDDNSTFSIYAYDEKVYKILPKTAMTPQGKLAAMDAIAPLVAGGYTALWDGLERCLNEANLNTDLSRNALVVLLTDGQPSSSPPDGEVAALRQYRTSTGTRARVVTIGLGYEINSNLLADLAYDAHSYYNFIPDGSMVITNTVNFLANEQTLYAHDTHICVAGDIRKSMSLNDSLNSSDCTYDGSTNTTRISVGLLRYGQSRDIVVSAVGTNDIRIEFTPYGQTTKWVITTPQVMSPVTAAQLIAHNRAATAIEKSALVASIDVNAAHKTLQTVAMDLLQSNASLPILKDISGEVLMSVSSRDNWRRWGGHYIRALLSAYKQQQCTNFKDKGIAGYGGFDYKQLKKTIDGICNSLPVPKPTAYQGYATATTTAAPAVSADEFTTSFNNADSGCFAGNCLITMANGTQKQCSAVRKGDVVATPNGSAKVDCVVVYSGEVTTLQLMNDLYITKYHPIFFEGMWHFPIDVKHYSEKVQDVVYNFVLSADHVCIVNGIACVTLGHNILGDKVASHDFFGTRKVVDALQRLHGYTHGAVFVNGDMVVRGADGRVCDYVAH